jgi:methenyltetrahydrofolate cyclohydrolase
VSDEPISYSSFAVIDLLDAFASNEPVPGGGAAAALAGSLGVSLLMMAAGLPKTRTMTAEEATDLAEASSRLRPLRESLIELIDRDADAYRAVMAALKLPKATDAEKAARRDALDAAMQGATDAPLDMMRACQQALAGAVVVAGNAYKLAASDVGMGIELVAAALRGCAMSIDGNLKGITDAGYVDRVSTERRQLEADGAADAERALALLVTARPDPQPSSASPTARPR